MVIPLANHIAGAEQYKLRGGPLDIQGGARSFFEKKCLSLSISKLKCLLPVVVKKKKFAHKIMENKMFDWTPWETPI